MKLRTLPVALVAFAISTPAMADFLSIRVGGGLWDHDPSGYIRYDGNSVGTNADLNSDLNLQKDKEGYAYVRFEHPVPLIPNIRIMSTKLKNAGSGTVTTEFTYGGETYTSGTAVTSELVLDHTDFTVYWEILDNIVSLDLGLNVKAVDGRGYVSDGTNTIQNDFDGLIPMLYGAVGVSPWPGLEFRGEISTLSIGDNSVTDTTVKVSYTTNYLLGVEAGIRNVSIELDDVDKVFSKMDFKGPFLGLYLHF